PRETERRYVVTLWPKRRPPDHRSGEPAFKFVPVGQRGIRQRLALAHTREQRARITDSTPKPRETYTTICRVSARWPPASRRLSRTRPVASGLCTYRSSTP